MSANAATQGLVALLLHFGRRHEAKVAWLIGMTSGTLLLIVGFHEDGVRSATQVCDAFNVERPF